jgi:hypothetical protein
MEVSVSVIVEQVLYGLCAVISITMGSLLWRTHQLQKKVRSLQYFLHLALISLGILICIMTIDPRGVHNILPLWSLLIFKDLAICLLFASFMLWFQRMAKVVVVAHCPVWCRSHPKVEFALQARFIIALPVAANFIGAVVTDSLTAAFERNQYRGVWLAIFGILLAIACLASFACAVSTFISERKAKQDKGRLAMSSRIPMEIALSGKRLFEKLCLCSFALFVIMIFEILSSSDFLARHFEGNARVAIAISYEPVYSLVILYFGVFVLTYVSWISLCGGASTAVSPHAAGESVDARAPAASVIAMVTQAVVKERRTVFKE